MTDAPSVTTVVVGARLPWPDDSWAGQDSGPFDSSAIYISGSRQACSIRKISALGATVSTDAAPALGERASVELATGQRAAGRVAWTGRNEVGVRFDDSIDVIALLNRKLVSQTRERRTMPRIEVRAPVHLKCGGQFFLAMLRNISARGLQIEGDELPAIGTYVSVLIEGLNIPPGEVVWKREKLAGIEVTQALSWTSIIPWVRGLVRLGAN
jgi:PilZ domain